MFIWIEDDSPEMNEFANKIDAYQKKRDKKSLENCGKTHFSVKVNKKTGKIISISVKFVKYTKEQIEQFTEEEVEINKNNSETLWKEHGVYFGRFQK